MISMTFGLRVGLASAVAALALAFAAEDARAAPPASASPSPSPSAPAPAASPAGPAAGAQAGEEASTRFKRGLQLFDEGDYALALVEFERAYQLAPNYRALYNIGLVNVQLGRYADATRTFNRYLHDGGDEITAARKAEVASAFAELKLRTSTIDISSNVPGAEVLLDGKPLDATIFHGPTLIDAGEHTLRASAVGFAPVLRTVTLAGGDVTSVRLQLVALSSLTPETPHERGRTLFIPGVIATGALAAGAIVTGAILLEERSKLSNLQNTPGSSAAQRTSAANEANSLAAAADICTGLAIVTGGVSVYMSLRIDHSPRSSSGTLGGSPTLVLSGTF
jgi:hypothetical protein